MRAPVTYLEWQTPHQFNPLPSQYLPDAVSGRHDVSADYEFGTLIDQRACAMDNLVIGIRNKRPTGISDMSAPRALCHRKQTFV